jgi:hypothetical protein
VVRNGPPGYVGWRAGTTTFARVDYIPSQGLRIWLLVTSWYWTVLFCTINQKPNSWTYNFVEISGHNLESSQAWGFRIHCLHYKPVSTHICSRGRGSKIRQNRTVTVNSKEENSLRLLSQLLLRIRPLEKFKAFSPESRMWQETVWYSADHFRNDHLPKLPRSLTSSSLLFS